MSRHRCCMHCKARQQQQQWGLCQLAARALAGPLRHAGTGRWHRQPVPRCVHAQHTCPASSRAPSHGPHLGLVELARLQRAGQHGGHLVIGHVRAAAAALFPEQPDLLQAGVLVVDELQQRQALPAHVPQHVLAHSGDAAQQRVNVGRDGAPLGEACSGAVQGSAGCSAQGSASCGVLHRLPVAHARSMARCCVE